MQIMIRENQYCKYIEEMLEESFIVGIILMWQIRLMGFHILTGQRAMKAMIS